jgi:ABC-2 type transport system ATP-binding protein
VENTTVDTALELKSLTKVFGKVRAVDGIDLVVPRGAMYGIIGPSGAGKTTAIRMIMSILFPDSGTLSVLGHGSALDAKDRIGYLPEERGVYRKMRVRAFLSFFAQLKGVPAAAAAARASKLLSRVGLADVEEKKCEDLSKGMLQRVQFVGSIINQPDLIILDEPFGGLDPVSVRLMKEVIAEENRRGATILFSTHVMAHAEEMCKHIVMINKGQKVLDEPMEGLRRQYDTRTVRLEPLDPAADIRILQKLPLVEKVNAADGGYDIRLTAASDPATSMRQIVDAVPPARIEFTRIRLEDIFIRIVTGEAEMNEGDSALRAHLQGLSGGGANS